MRTNIVNVKEFLGDTNKLWKYLVIITKYSLYFPQPNDYPNNLMYSAINKFLRNIDNIDAAKNIRNDSSSITVPVPFKDQNSANSVRSKCKFWAPTLVSKLNALFTFRPLRLAKFSLLRTNVPKNQPLTKTGLDSGSDRIGSDRIGICRIIIFEKKLF